VSVGRRTLGAMETRISALGTIMGIWVHPDDEAYLSGGLMALARANGQRVVCVTATRGELGTATRFRQAARTAFNLVYEIRP
jgi:LmbE family N-acetylglucosaminyl deacetylase